MVFQLGSALLDACVLSVLSGEDAYGYAITQTVKQVIEVSESSLYPVLRRLQKEGCLTTYDQPYQGRNRRYYSLTEMGGTRLVTYRSEWNEYKEKVDGIIHGTPRLGSGEATKQKSDSEVLGDERDPE